MIGIFDSGIGGLTVVKAVMHALPNYKIIYFGDTARTPYGNKSPEVVTQYAREDAQFLLSKEVSMIIIGCNTASAAATNVLRKELNVPVFEVIAPAVRLALTSTKNGRVGVIGTRATIGSGAYRNQLAHHNKKLFIFEQACPLLVPLVEEGMLRNKETEMMLRTYLAPILKKNIDTLILGCTHYPLLKPLIQKIVGKRIHLVDSASAVAYEVKEYVKAHPKIHKKLQKGQSQFFVSDRTLHAEKIASHWLNCKIRLQLVYAA